MPKRLCRTRSVSIVKYLSKNINFNLSKNFRIFGLKSSLVAFKKVKRKESESVLSEVERSFGESQFCNCFTVVQKLTDGLAGIWLSFSPIFH
jgi:hypothetical protein